MGTASCYIRIKEILRGSLFECKKGVFSRLKSRDCCQGGRDKRQQEKWQSAVCAMMICALVAAPR